MIDYKKELNLYFELKNTPQSSRESYSRRLEAFIKYYQAKNKDKNLKDITYGDIQDYILYLKQERKLSAGTINNYISSIRFFYVYLLGKEWDVKKIPRMKREHKLPVIPPAQDVNAILSGTDNLKHMAIMSLIYGSGLRVGEVARLKIRDICSETMTVRIENAKHGTNRYTILSERTLKVLREYFRAYFSSYKLEDWLFPGRKQGQHISTKAIKNTVIKLKNKLQLDPAISAHTLRHCFATHSLENGVELALIQQLLGHKNISTTTNYLHLTSKSLMGIKSPLDTYDGEKK